MSKETSSQEFEPNWAVSPGSTVAAILSARSMSREVFAGLLGQSIESVQRLISGLEKVDEDLADRLASCLGSSSSFWLNRQTQYQEDLDRIRQNEANSSLECWVKQFPIRDMTDLGWIPKNPSSVARECLKFFGVRDVASWQARYNGATAAASFRMTTSATANPGPVIAWLRWAELVADRIHCGNWDSNAFRVYLEQIKPLTWQKDPSTFLSRLRTICGKAGVAVVIARTPKGCPASGATRFLSSTKALMVLSFRYRSDDQFWFTFFHEAAHLLLHKHSELFLEDGSDITADEEREANEFAQALIIPPMHTAEFRTLELTETAILRFSRKIGISPGLVVGQLQHCGRLGHQRFHSLKRHYAWSEIEGDQLIP
jgi:plasmid maintenance system antidote protein VapI